MLVVVAQHVGFGINGGDGDVHMSVAVSNSSRFVKFWRWWQHGAEASARARGHLSAAQGASAATIARGDRHTGASQHSDLCAVGVRKHERRGVIGGIGRLPGDIGVIGRPHHPEPR